MMGRMDLRLERCLHCEGKGTDPKNRKRQCPKCQGTGQWEVCVTCNVPLPCPGTEEGVMDQTVCRARRAQGV